MLENKKLFKVLEELIDNKRNKRKLDDSTQSLFDYVKMNGNGVCQVTKTKYNKMVEFSDISYQLSRDDMKKSLFSQYCAFLNSFDSSCKLQLEFMNFRLNDEKQEIFLDEIETVQDDKDFQKMKNEYFSFIEEQKLKGNNGILRKKYLLFTIEDNNYSSAVRRLENIEKQVQSGFRSLGVKTTSYSGLERLSVLNMFINNQSKNYKDLEDYSKEQLVNVSTKDMIAPANIDFESDNTIFKVDKKFGSTLHFLIEATELSDRVLADFLDLDIEQAISLHIRSLSHKKAVKMVKSKSSDLTSIKIEEQKKALRTGYDMDILSTDLNMNVDGSKKLLNDLQQENEKYFFLTFTLTPIAPTKSELKNSIEQLSTVAQKHNCSLETLPLQQEKALQSALPMGVNINEKELERGLTTTSTAIFVPFTTQELYQEDKDPVYYGLNSLSNNMIQVSRKKLKNPNGLFLGTPGSGKSFSAKREMIDTFLKTLDDIIISDPEGEYTPFVHRLGGEVIEISADSHSFINPLDITLEYGEGENPISYKSDFIIDMMNLIVGVKTGITAKQKTAVDKCVRVIYRDYVADPKKENIPVLKDLYNALLDLGTQEATDLADALELYVSGSLNIFNNRTNINSNNRLICFNIQGLGANLKDLGMFVLQDHVWNKVTTNRNKHKTTWYYMDEFHRLLADAQTAGYSVQFWKRFRKWGGIPTGITQNVKDLLASPQIETIIENSDFIYLLNQSDGDRRILQEKFNISNYQANYITNSNEGEGLIIYNGTILPFKDKFPKDNSLYPVMTTKLDEIKKLRATHG